MPFVTSPKAAVPSALSAAEYLLTLAPSNVAANASWMNEPIETASAKPFAVGIVNATRIQPKFLKSVSAVSRIATSLNASREVNIAFESALPTEVHAEKIRKQ